MYDDLLRIGLVALWVFGVTGVTVVVRVRHKIHGDVCHLEEKIAALWEEIRKSK